MNRSLEEGHRKRVLAETAGDFDTDDLEEVNQRKPFEDRKESTGLDLASEAVREEETAASLERPQKDDLD